MTDNSGTPADDIQVLSDEQRAFAPSAEFVGQALIADTSVYDEAASDLEGFWLRRTLETIEWATAAHRVAEVGSAALHLVCRRPPERLGQLP